MFPKFDKRMEWVFISKRGSQVYPHNAAKFRVLEVERRSMAVRQASALVHLVMNTQSSFFSGVRQNLCVPQSPHL